ncbi:hypothetical protein TIFTF001_049389 [Ficus carica]|uniref:Uncharacterized protein n=1 Tax=Ficus carica TaxID=3494 RepID=A0AA87ZQ66_FICCA|nr:hypothetical protein TIFTF001_049389 [Ficus carica]
MEGGVRRDQWGYEVTTYSDACISAINDYYHQRRKTTKTVCWPTFWLPISFRPRSSYPSLAPSYLHAAKSRLEQATSYEKAVFDV